MTGVSLLRLAVILMLLAGTMRATLAAEVLETEPRPGVTLRMLADVPADAKAIAMLFPGGAGKVRIDADGRIRGTKGNFLTRSRDLFIAAGIGTALVDAPSDQWDEDGLTYARRMAPARAGEIGQAIARLRETWPGRKIWLVGTSRGTLDAASAAATLGDKGPDGLVLTSTIGRDGKQGGTVLDLALDRIAVPVLLVHHAHDGCAVTPPEAAPRIRNRLTGAPAAELVMMDGGDSGHGRACDATTHHGFLGIEDKAIHAIAAWIGSR